MSDRFQRIIRKSPKCFILGFCNTLARSAAQGVAKQVDTIPGELGSPSLAELLQEPVTSDDLLQRPFSDVSGPISLGPNLVYTRGQKDLPLDKCRPVYAKGTPKDLLGQIF